MSKFIDLAYQQDDDSFFDLVIEGGDFRLSNGLETPLLVSLFSDRRAYESEVRDPLRRRGWIGDLVPAVPGDIHGSGLWLYEQHRLTDEVVNGVRVEAQQAVQWMSDDALISHATCSTSRQPAERRINLSVALHFIDGQVTQEAFALADATAASGVITTNPTP